MRGSQRQWFKLLLSAKRSDRGMGLFSQILNGNIRSSHSEEQKVFKLEVDGWNAGLINSTCFSVSCMRLRHLTCLYKTGRVGVPRQRHFLTTALETCVQSCILSAPPLYTCSICAKLYKNRTPRFRSSSFCYVYKLHMLPILLHALCSFHKAITIPCVEGRIPPQNVGTPFSRLDL